MLVAGAVIALGWIALSFSPCEYQLRASRPSPSERYVAEFYSADCGMADYETLVVLRHQYAVALPHLDGRPPGTAITREFAMFNRRADIRWESESVLVLQYIGDEPLLLRREWSGVRIETRVAP